MDWIGISLAKNTIADDSWFAAIVAKRFLIVFVEV